MLCSMHLALDTSLCILYLLLMYGFGFDILFFDVFFFLMIRRPPRSTLSSSSAASDVYKRQSYVKWVESAGAMVVPLPFDLPEEKLAELLGQLNGLLFPGGGAHISGNSSYAAFSRKVFKWAVDQAVPTWGTCLGFEQLLLYSSGGDVLSSGFDSEALFLPLDMPDDLHGTFLEPAPTQVLTSLRGTNMTVNLHTSGVTPGSFRSDAKLNSTWIVLATNRDRRGKQFVSLAQSRTLPMFASQWHPEKNAFEYDQSWDSPLDAQSVHSADAVSASAWLASEFVDRARRNSRSFSSKDAFRNASIFNFSPVYTDKRFPGKDLWEQTYILSLIHI
eukprot:TRINITY_DN4064_c0_g1_i3.p1 TRINITY_DN4064_c0_g1~~TRINITY_DN4064_c0_g1_i3.p1  ORF type:complete len:332 (+),score=59.47 TRINITY_DN4064_c0_g1_i3:20-1015(+)